MNKNIIRYFFICFIYFFCIVTAAKSDIPSYNGVSVIEFPNFSINLESLCYQVKRLRFVNNNSYEHNIVICLENAGRSIKKSFVLQGGETKTEYIYGPGSKTYNQLYLNVYIDGVKLDYSFEKATTKSGVTYSILVDPNISSSLFEDFMITNEEIKTTGKAGSGKKGSGSNRVESIYRNSIEKFSGSLEQLPALWQAYMGFSALVLNSDSLVELDFKIKEAVFDYVRMGGYLVVFGKKAKYPEDMILRLDKDVFRTGELGLGYITEVDLDINNEEALAVHSFAFKHKYQMAASEIGEHILSKSSNAPIMKFTDNEILVYDEFLLSFITVVFALILGPVNFIYLYKKRRQMLVFITVPVISVLLCLAIFIYYQLFESSLLNIKKNSFIMLNENTNKAMILSNYAIFSAKSRNNCMEFPNSAAIFPSDKGFSLRYNEDIYGSIELGSTQMFTTNWIHAKTIEEYKIFDIENVRDRIEFTGENDGISALNCLSGDILKLVYKDYFGRVYTSDSIKVGHSVRLKQKTKRSNGHLKDIVSRIYFEFYCRDEVCNDLATSPEEYLTPGQYYVEMESSSILKQKIENKAQVSEITYLIGTRKRER